MRAPAIVFFALVALTFAPVEAHACSCVATTPEEGVAAADAIFEGVVRESVLGEGGPLASRRVELAVHRVWKGEVEPITIVTTANNSAACGFGFVNAERYLVYARKTDRGHHVSLCSRTTQMATAQDDLAVLGTPTHTHDPAAAPSTPKANPAAPPVSKESQCGCKRCGIDSGVHNDAAIAAMLAFCTLLLFRRTMRS